jgi:hypothetical protein
MRVVGKTAPARIGAGEGVAIRGRETVSGKRNGGGADGEDAGGAGGGEASVEQARAPPSAVHPHGHSVPVDGGGAAVCSAFSNCPQIAREIIVARAAGR